MGDTTWGVRDARGEWRPELLPQPSPIFQWPWRPVKILKYLFGPQGFLWPYNLAVALISVLCWLFFTPSLSVARSLGLGWIAEIFVRNVVLVVIVSGGMHLRLYATKGQGTKFKYSDKWLAKRDKRFLFGDQTWDNVFWSLGSGCIFWTAWEAITLWAYANKLIPYVHFSAHPIYSVLLMVAVIYLRQIHFFFIHRLIHWKPLYRISHYLHHKNINIGPWSGLAMHPLEHLLYFSGALLHWIIPSGPIHAIYHLIHAGLTPALGHSGFHKFVGKGERGLTDDNYFHYLHHRWFTVNFGNEAVPLDLWFGSFLDGSPESEAALLARRAKAKNS
jgi:sterol desaturase/sphingolipid hydroxylase (fatty acid hydroxylase superfamily)